MKNIKMKGVIISLVVLLPSIFTTQTFAELNAGIEFNVVECISDEKCYQVLQTLVPVQKIDTVLSKMIQESIYKSIFGKYEEFNDKSVKVFFSTYNNAFITLSNQNAKITNFLQKMITQFNKNQDVDFEKQRKNFCTDLSKSNTRLLYRNSNLTKFIEDYIMLDREDNQVPVSDEIAKLYEKHFNEFINYGDRKSKLCNADFTTLNAFNKEYIKQNKRLLLVNSLIAFQKEPSNKNKSILTKYYNDYKKSYGEPNISSDVQQEQLDLLIFLENSKKQFENMISLF
ncbi:MAG: hypothetical protein AB7E37_04030 [Candidatus Altimarinota bacterium]